VGTSDFDLIAGQLGPETFSLPIFLLDVGLTAVVLLFAGRRRGWLGVLVAALAGLGTLILVLLMYSKNLDYVGFPIPVNLRSTPSALAAPLVWLDMALWAIGAGALVGRIGRSTQIV
jgi:hypothetical protein